MPGWPVLGKSFAKAQIAKVLYITPFLSEVDRVRAAVPTLNFQVPYVTAGANGRASKQNGLLMNPVLAQWFRSKGVEVDHNAFAVSELLQWLFRSRIRRKEPIKVFLPSKRMRSLLMDWVSGKDLVSIP